ncbi:MAG TPA: hypothetical protein VN772_03355 [Solirubrobacteraceae bacterium]|nr:hypothetical protein [Solirubrobacteraceae bacterium]
MAAAVGVPLALLTLLYCVQPRDYNLGTDSVEVHGFPARAAAGRRVCIPGLLIPGGTAGLRLVVVSQARPRPTLRLTLTLPGRTLHGRIGSLGEAPAGRQSAAVFSIPALPVAPSPLPARACLTAAGAVAWGGTALPSPPAVAAPTVGGAPISGRIAVWYLPRRGAQQSYLEMAGTILARASLFRAGWVAPWVYWVALLGVLPAIAFVSLRCLALAAAGRPPRRVALWLFAVAAINFACWALVSPAFEAPDESDHFAYAQSLLERGQTPARNPASRLAPFSSAERLALEAISYSTQHTAADSRPPWLSQQRDRYLRRAAALRPAADDGGGYETAATHGPIYYAALAPAYALAGTSPFSQLTLMRLASALIGALTVLFTYLLARELAPGRPWLAVAAALLGAYQPMYGFISGAVNNDVGVNAGAAALELLLIRMLRRGITVPTGAATGVLLLALPAVKGTAFSLYPVAVLVLGAVLWQRHARTDRRGWIAFASAAALTGLLVSVALGGVHTAAAAPGPSAIGSNATAVGGALGDIPGFLSYLWQAFLPRLPGMTAHFPASEYPFYTIFVIRGWAAFGSYTAAFPDWVYGVITGAMIATILLCPLAAGREWGWVRSHALELAALVAMPAAVIVGFEAAYYTPGLRPVIAEVGRYAFPAIGPLAVLVVGALHAFGRHRLLAVTTAVLVAMIGLSFASQLLTLTSFYA